jgi:GntR family histidine utilization transcriptional repressor
MSSSLPLQPRPLQALIRQDIEARIRSGEWRPGMRIPLERELMQQYGCSRMTVHAALKPLEAEGLIERRRRAGTFVRGPRLDAAILAIPDLQNEIEARGQAYQFDVLTRAVQSAVSQPERELAGAGRPVLSVEGLHLAAGRPLAHERRLINLDAVPQARDVDFTQVSPGRWLLQAVPWTEAEHRISAEISDAPIMRLLRLDLPEACLVMERRTWRGDQRITSVRQVFDARAYQLTARFQH